MIDLTMTHNQFMDWLRSHQCCPAGYAAVMREGWSEREAWEQSENPSWLLWYIGMSGGTAVQLVTCAMVIARAVQDNLGAAEQIDVGHLLDTASRCSYPGEFNTAALVTVTILVAELSCSLGLSRRGACEIIRRVFV